MATGAPIVTSTATRPITMPTDTHLLTLAQWLSPAYPLGSFAYSHGLEQAIAARWVTDADDLRIWLHDILTEGSGRADAIWLHAAWAAQDEQQLLDLDAQARSFAPARERLREGDRQGAAFARTTAEVWGVRLPALLLPLAVGAAARQHGMEPIPVAALYLHSFAGNLVSAATRLMPLGQTQAQSVLAGLSETCATLAEHSRDLCPDDIHSTAILSDIAAMQHETLEPRLFQS